MSATEETPTTDSMIERAKADSAYREGLRDAAALVRAQGEGCPAGMAAVYVERVAKGEQP